MSRDLAYTVTASFPKSVAGGRGRLLGNFSSSKIWQNSGTYRKMIGSVVWRYGIAVSFVAVALSFEKLLQFFFPYPFLLLFFCAVTASAWYGGTGPGLFAVFLSIFFVDYFFLPPLDILSINAHAITYSAAFIVSGLFASWVSTVTKRSKSVLKEAHDQLELRITERSAELKKTNAELREKEHQLAHLSRALTLGELTSSIAHEITQPLTAVVLHGESCLECLSIDPPNLELARDAVSRIIDDGSRAGEVLSRIRTLFKKETLAKDRFNMNELIRELTVFLREAVISQHVALQADLASDLPEVVGDRVQLQQVMLNLMMNGIDAMDTIMNRPKELVIRSHRQNSSEIRICVEDSGVGLREDTIDKLFDPFFTTKQQGIGMGLSISRSIVESHGGRLWAASKPTCGAIFEFTIPIESNNHDA